MVSDGKNKKNKGLTKMVPQWIFWNTLWFFEKIMNIKYLHGST